MEYGKNDKRISFMDTDKRAAELIIRLKHDGLTKAKFFRSILTAYLERDAALVDLIERVKTDEGFQSKSRARTVKKLEEKGDTVAKKFGLDAGEIENIFDMLEKELPDL